MRVSLIRKAQLGQPALEIIERKGIGHPDTMSDDLAERLSRCYASYTLSRFGVVLHHNFDKVGLLGGRSEVAFGHGRIVEPIRVLLNGRATRSCGGESIPVAELLESEALRFLSVRFPSLDLRTHVKFIDNISTAGSPGHVRTDVDTPGARGRWFAPRDATDLREATTLQSNDTSVGCAHFPLTPLESCVLEIERRLTGNEYRARRPWLGTDVKVMACRTHDVLDLTMCVPQIADFVPDALSYRAHLAEVRTDVLNWVRAALGDRISVNLFMNTKDDFDIPELYLTAIGSSIESGDEGLVGRGNRTNGLISMCRPYSMEGACGKNPVYHTGKLYNVLASRLAEALAGSARSPVETWLIGQEGRPLADPWNVVVAHDSDTLLESDVVTSVEKIAAALPSITEDILNARVGLF